MVMRMMMVALMATTRLISVLAMVVMRTMATVVIHETDEPTIKLTLEGTS